MQVGKPADVLALVQGAAIPLVLDSLRLFPAVDAASNVILQAAELVENEDASDVESDLLTFGYAVWFLRLLELLEFIGPQIENLHVLHDGLAQDESVDIHPRALPHRWYVGISIGIKLEAVKVFPDESECFIGVPL